MKRYHILWKNNEEEFYSQGEDFEAMSEVAAIGSWRIRYPNAIFYACYVR